MKVNFSFLQISELGKFLKKMAEKKQLNFFLNHGFDDEEISKVANMFGRSIIEQIKEDLIQSPFSLTVDNVTVASKSICGLQVKYFKQYFDEENLRRTSIENRIIGLKYLQDSSTIEKLHEVVNEKLLSLAPEIPNNFH